MISSRIVSHHTHRPTRIHEYAEHTSRSLDLNTGPEFYIDSFRVDILLSFFTVINFDLAHNVSFFFIHLSSKLFLLLRRYSKDTLKRNNHGTCSTDLYASVNPQRALTCFLTRYSYQHWRRQWPITLAQASD